MEFAVGDHVKFEACLQSKPISGRGRVIANTGKQVYVTLLDCKLPKGVTLKTPELKIPIELVHRFDPRKHSVRIAEKKVVKEAEKARKAKGQTKADRRKARNLLKDGDNVTRFPSSTQNGVPKPTPADLAPNGPDVSDSWKSGFTYNSTIGKYVRCTDYKQMVE